MNELLLRKFAKLAVIKGVNIQKDQVLRINCPIEAAGFGRLCLEEAYLAGAKRVIIDYYDELASKLNYELAGTEVLCDFPEYLRAKQSYLIDENVANLSIIGETPGLLKDIDPEKLQKVMVANSVFQMPYHNHFMSNKSQWSLVGYPTGGWAKKVYPNLDEETAKEKLWENILLTSRVTMDEDPLETWNRHNAEMLKHNEIMNNYNFSYLTFKNSACTDLKLYLADQHNWSGGCENTMGGVVFNPNIPTEECFCMPYKTKVDGKVVATKPLNYQGKLIEDFYLIFKEGRVVEFDAKKEKEALKNLLEFDEGSCYLGEVALISDDSPINNTGILFYNTLYDENASCHLALGAAYPMNIKGGVQMEEEELFKFGYNKSMAHEDFMFGSPDMEIEGYTADGEKVTIFQNGNFVF